jgi:hypothetical protein
MSVVHGAYTILTTRTWGSKDGLIGLDKGRIKLKGAGRVSFNCGVLQFLSLLEAPERLSEEESGIDGLGGDNVNIV